MNKNLVLGDTHGRTIWKEIIEKENPDKVIFLGDYVSSHEGITAEQQLRNLNEILEYKEENPEKVILLRGNHDDCELGYYWAICYPNEPKVREVMSVDPLKSRFLSNTQWVYIDEELKIIFSHAGISQVWMKENNINDVHDINSLPPSEIFGFTPDDPYDNSGYSKTQPPTWIRPSILCQCNITEWDQVVGHTPQNNVTRMWKNCINKRSIWLCDALGNSQYLVIDNGEFQPKIFNTNE